MTRGVQCGIALVVALAGLGLACSTPRGEHYDAFEIPPDQLRQRVTTVAVASLDVPADLVDPARARALIEPRVAAMLTGAGYRVVPPEEWDRRWLAAAQAAGPIWDPVTGKRDDARYE